MKERRPSRPQPERRQPGEMLPSKQRPIQFTAASSEKANSKNPQGLRRVEREYRPYGSPGKHYEWVWVNKNGQYVDKDGWPMYPDQHTGHLKRLDPLS